MKTEAVVDAAFLNGDWTCVNVSSLAELLIVPNPGSLHCTEAVEQRSMLRRYVTNNPVR